MKKIIDITPTVIHTHCLDLFPCSQKHRQTETSVLKGTRAIQIMKKHLLELLKKEKNKTFSFKRDKKFLFKLLKIMFILQLINVLEHCFESFLINKFLKGK